jgi:hypothetical protein
MRRIALALALLAAAGAPGFARADTVLDGSTDGGAFFRIVVPTAWNGDLVIWNHGFSLSPIGPVSDLGPLAALQLSEGYAVAASSYQQRGWALFKTKNDLQNLVGVFVANFGTPNRVLVTGASLGGIVTAAAVEKANLGNLAGAFTFCGATAGSRNWDGALDLRLVYDAICDSVPGASIPGGAEGLPAGSTRTVADNALSAHACFGILAPPAFRTPAQAARLAQFLAETDIPENFVVTDVAFYTTLGMSDLVHDPAKLDGRVGTGNIGVVYEDPAIDAAIARVSAQPGAANRLEKNYTPDGSVGATKNVALYTDKDGLVIVENGSEYASVVPGSNLSLAVAVEAVPTHCGFTNAEVVSGWESLRGWVGGGAQPTPASLQVTCLALAPFFGGPCRIAPGFVIPDMDGRIPPR